MVFLCVCEGENNGDRGYFSNELDKVAAAAKGKERAKPKGEKIVQDV